MRPAAQPLLDDFANVIRNSHSQALITVEGFADPAGSTRFNQRLGMERAEAVRGYLQGSGTLTGSLRAVSYGEAVNRQVVPGAKGPGEEGMQNRRVALVIEDASMDSTAAPASVSSAN